jgi:hypothetical protein
MTETINSTNAAASTLFLGHNGEWWDFWLIVSVIVAALAATVIGIATTGSIVSHKREAMAAEEALEKYKLEMGKQISTANAAGETAKADAAEATRKAEAERSERLKLEAKLAPRRVDVVQQATISQTVSKFAGKMVRLESYALDAEAAILGTQIQKALNDGGLVIDSALMTRQSGGSIALAVHVIGTDKNLVDALISALNGAHVAAVDTDPFPAQGGIKTEIRIGSSIPNPSDATIFVGVKPIQ